MIPILQMGNHSLKKVTPLCQIHIYYVVQPRYTPKALEERIPSCLGLTKFGMGCLEK